MPPFFDEMFDYNYQCNRVFIRFIQRNSHLISEKTIRIFSHILNSHQIWNCKIINHKERFTVSQLHSVDDFSDINEKNYRQTVTILKNSDLRETIQYTTSGRNKHSNTISDILFQIINHSTYHRGQIALELRLCGLDPFLTDYIYYKWNSAQL